MTPHKEEMQPPRDMIRKYTFYEGMEVAEEEKKKENKV